MLRITRVITCLIIVSSLFWVTATTNSYAQEQEDEGQYEKLFNQPYEMKGHWAERLFQWAMAENIINGYPNSTLMPDKPISEAEFLKALYRAMGIALPSASSLEEFNSSDDWTEGAYRLAKYFNHPTLGASNHKLRMEPLTKLRAAEIITAAQGVHYVDEDAVVYLIGNGMANSDTISPEQFHGQDSFSRAEAIQWIRQLSFKGMMDISIRPTAASDRNLLPSLPSVAVQRIPDFSAELVARNDFDLFGSSPFAGVKVGDSKKTIEGLFGVSDDKDVFDKHIYPLFSAHYNKEGFVDAWKIDQDSIEPTITTPLLRTNKGIVLGESTLFDVLRLYGTFGFTGDYVATYYYEKTPDGKYRDISIYDKIINPENVYTLSFIFDRESLAVVYVLSSWLPYDISPT
ncbi:S-layer homology domain-containing protein [Bacillus sp. FJAT-26390]|uniref:S-layer homology domain-containing protein n=1 Tax=Bacillus sp. FJAT-26390 TaxID=1743142 RepID=UPI000807F11D|nr:S-layer homology domain-containing protein [Bacillus sp. FJAT-26390]OBZ11116.1 hypothetical protein A7975_19285 [Bacillus sp. FJAT-26390]